MQKIRYSPRFCPRYLSAWDMASAVIVFPDMSISGEPAFVSLLLSPRASVPNVMPALNE